jgi:hypothetical protein
MIMNVTELCDDLLGMVSKFVILNRKANEYNLVVPSVTFYHTHTLRIDSYPPMRSRKLRPFKFLWVFNI